MSSTAVHSNTPLYTVEQLELIRRLKNSGINKDDIVSAFDSFEKIDKELGPVYNIPVALALQAQALQLMAFNLTSTSTLSSSSSSGSTATLKSSSINSQSSQISTSIIMPKLSVQAGDNSSIDAAINSSITAACKSFIVQDSDVDTKEFLDFISQGDTTCCEEIRAFAAKHNIKQQQIATLAGICQSYVSRYMKGDIYDMSERSRRAIQKWYLVYRKNPASIGLAANAAMHIINATSNASGGTVVKKLINPSSIDLSDLTSQDVAFPRRERFVFRPNHLEILEKYFQDNNYPSYETREEIAQACNIVTENAAGRELTEREKVTAQIISNWFANKRKELKKLAREEGLLDVSVVPSRPRGHPSRLYSDLALMQQYKSNDAANSAVTSSVMQSPESSSQDDGCSPTHAEEKNYRNEANSDKKIKLQSSCDGESAMTWSVSQSNQILSPLVNQGCLVTKSENILDASSSIF